MRLKPTFLLAIIYSYIHSLQNYFKIILALQINLYLYIKLTQTSKMTKLIIALEVLIEQWVKGRGYSVILLVLGVVFYSRGVNCDPLFTNLKIICLPGTYLPFSLSKSIFIECLYIACIEILS